MNSNHEIRMITVIYSDVSCLSRVNLLSFNCHRLKPQRSGYIPHRHMLLFFCCDLIH